MTIAVDFDGTIVEHKYPEIGKELPFAIDTLKKLSANGHKLILWSVREGERLDDAVKFCHDRGLDFYAVNCEYPGGAWNGQGARKIRADIYLDDRNLGGIPDWNMIYRMITDHMTYNDMIDALAASDDSGTDEPAIYNGTFRGHSSSHHHHRHRHHRDNIFTRIVERCREARLRYEH